MDFLKQLYLGNIFPIDGSICHVPEYQAAQRTFTEQYTALRKDLTPDTEKELEKCMETQNLILSIQDEASFKLGFRLGVQMMCACFYGEDVT